MRARSAFAIGLAAFFVVATAGAVRAAAPVLTHELAGYALGAETLALDYTLHITNPSPDEALSQLVLTLVPLRIAADDLVSATVDYLAPGATVDVPVRLTTGALIEQPDAGGQVLYWAGTAVAADGSAIEFPAESAPLIGGAQ